ncbi:hypothetical protein [Yinghuangia seranimata]|uniref:hypothetical protein n=1 Tax=Yinghuangia seranimata TaxID=408067 RepID=UPI00248AA3EF|nr:hypothetical protein [Yinghuangia seranimata]MDI2125744.1 hypothetical protein [Yinghuangia seranimata]
MTQDRTSRADREREQARADALAQARARHQAARATAARGDDALDPGTAAGSRFAELPARVAPDQVIAETPASPPASPDMGRDAERDWMLRYTP